MNGPSTVFSRSFLANPWERPEGRPFGFNWMRDSFSKGKKRSIRTDGDGDGEAAWTHECSRIERARMEEEARREGAD